MANLPPNLAIVIAITEDEENDPDIPFCNIPSLPARPIDYTPAESVSRESSAPPDSVFDLPSCLDEFTLFPKLPIELRLRTFNFMLPAPQNIDLGLPLFASYEEIQAFGRTENVWHRDYRATVQRKPITLYINQESRRETLKSYKFVLLDFKWAALAFDPAKPATVASESLAKPVKYFWLCMDPHKDYFTSHSANLGWFSQMVAKNPECFENIKTFIIDWENHRLPVSFMAERLVTVEREGVWPLSWDADGLEFPRAVLLLKSLKTIKLVCEPRQHALILGSFLKGFTRILAELDKNRTMPQILIHTDGVSKIMGDEIMEIDKDIFEIWISDYKAQVLQCVYDGEWQIEPVVWKDTEMCVLA